MAQGVSRPPQDRASMHLDLEGARVALARLKSNNGPDFTIIFLITEVALASFVFIAGVQGLRGRGGSLNALWNSMVTLSSMLVIRYLIQIPLFLLENKVKRLSTELGESYTDHLWLFDDALRTSLESTEAYTSFLQGLANHKPPATISRPIIRSFLGVTPSKKGWCWGDRDDLYKTIEDQEEAVQVMEQLKTKFIQQKDLIEPLKKLSSVASAEKFWTKRTALRFPYTEAQKLIYNTYLGYLRFKEERAVSHLPVVLTVFAVALFVFSFLGIMGNRFNVKNMFSPKLAYLSALLPLTHFILYGAYYGGSRLKREIEVSRAIPSGSEAREVQIRTLDEHIKTLQNALNWLDQHPKWKTSEQRRLAVATISQFIQDKESLIYRRSNDKSK